MYRPCKARLASYSALMNPMSRRFVATLDGFIARHEVPLVRFHKSQRKDEMMAERLGSFAAADGLVFRLY